jgi:penicillin-binding protein 2
MSIQKNLIKNAAVERRIFNFRIIFAIVITILLFFVITFRMVDLQLFHYSHYQTLSNKNRITLQPIKPNRGLIYDRNGNILAENIPSYSIEIIAERINDIDSILAMISSLIEISQNDLERFNKEYPPRLRFLPIPLRSNLSIEEVSRLSVELYKMPGVEIESRLARYYPYGELTAHSVGYVGKISEADLRYISRDNYIATRNIGKTGIERTYEQILHGLVGTQQVEVNAVGRKLRILAEESPIPGQNIITNLDIGLHKVAIDAFGEERGALVAISPQDGKVLALVSLPSFDPNLFVHGIRTYEYKRLESDKGKPLFNRALNGQYPPGSTTKPFLGLAGLEANIISKDDKIFCPGFYLLKGDDRRYRDWKRSGHGVVDLNKSVVESCDVYYYDLAFKLGIDSMADFFTQFGFGTKSGFDGGNDATGLMPSRSWKLRNRRIHWFPGETLIAGIGQGYMLTTPLQLAVATSMLANRGRHYQPQIINRIEDAISSNSKIFEPVVMNLVSIQKPENWLYIEDTMINVIHSGTGTARGLNISLPYRIAGKTGTSQVFSIKQDEEYNAESLEKRLRDHALFIAYAPVDNPIISVALIVENGGGGGTVAAPIARAVIDEYLNKVRPDIFLNAE